MNISPFKSSLVFIATFLIVESSLHPIKILAAPSQGNLTKYFPFSVALIVSLYL